MVNILCEKGRTPLFSAVKIGPATVVQRFLGANANVKIKDKLGCTPLHFACESKYIYGKAKADIVRLLLKAGVEVDHVNNKGQSALFLASIRGEHASVRALLDHGANPNIQDHNAETPLSIAVKAKPNKSYDDDYIPPTDYLATIALLLDAKADVNIQDKNGRSLLFGLLKDGELDRVPFLVRQGANVNLRDSTGRTPLSIIAGRQPIRARSSISSNRNYSWPENLDATMNLLLDSGARIDEQDNKGWTPLFYACWQGNSSAAKILLSRGADPYLTGKDGKTALSIANSAAATRGTRGLGYHSIIQALEARYVKLPYRTDLSTVFEKGNEN